MDNIQRLLNNLENDTCPLLAATLKGLLAKGRLDVRVVTVADKVTGKEKEELLWTLRQHAVNWLEIRP